MNLIKILRSTIVSLGIISGTPSIANQEPIVEETKRKPITIEETQSILEKPEIYFKKNPLEVIREVSLALGWEISDDTLLKIINSIVLVIPYDEKGKIIRKLGTGFFISQDRVLSNRHVFEVEGAKFFRIYSLQGEFSFSQDPILSDKVDLGVVRIKETSRYFLSFSNEDIEMGDKVITFGFGPESGLESAFQKRLRKFRLNAEVGVKGVFPDNPKITNKLKENSHSFNMWIDGGDSGSPVINSRGEVISVLHMANLSLDFNTEHGFGVKLPDIVSFLRENEVVSHRGGGDVRGAFKSNSLTKENIIKRFKQLGIFFMFNTHIKPEDLIKLESLLNILEREKKIYNMIFLGFGDPLPDREKLFIRINSDESVENWIKKIKEYKVPYEDLK